MKKLLFLTAIAVLTFNTSIAQEDVVVVDDTSSEVENPTRKGRIIGIVAFNFRNGDVTQKHSAFVTDTKIKNNTLGFDLNAGYTIIDNLSIGLSVGINYDKSKNEFDDLVGSPGTAHTEEEKVTTSFYMFQSRYYFLKEKFKPFVGAAIGYNAQDITGSSKNNTANTNYALSGGGLVWRLSGGLAYFINDNVGFNIAYSYASMNNDKTGSGTYGTFDYDFTADDTNVINNIIFGVQIAF
jgi:opacity protein-like surface antigen